MTDLVMVINTLRTGGAENVCVTLANGLARKGKNIELLLLKTSADDLRGRLEPGILVRDLRCEHARNAFWALFRYIGKSRPDLILSFNRQISVVLVVIRLLTRMKYKIVSRNIIFLSQAEKSKRGVWHGFAAKHLIRWFYPLSDVFIAQSQAMAEDLGAYLKVTPGRITTIPNPVSERIEKHAEQACRSRYPRENYILCIGKLEQQKNFSTAIRVFQRISAKVPGLRLTIVGEGVLRSELQQLAADLSIADRVDFKGARQEVARYFLGARLTLLTSHFEGFPNVLLESIALGTPVVAFDCQSGPAEIIQEGINGYLARYPDEAHLESMILHSLARDWNEEEIRQTSRRFNSDGIIRRYEQVLFQ